MEASERAIWFSQIAGSHRYPPDIVGRNLLVPEDGDCEVDKMGLTRSSPRQMARYR